MLAMNCGDRFSVTIRHSRSNDGTSLHSVEAQSKELKESFRKSYDERIDELRGVQEEAATFKAELSQRMEGESLDIVVFLILPY
jgi:hypothetical protein